MCAEYGVFCTVITGSQKTLLPSMLSAAGGFESTVIDACGVCVD